MDIIMLSALGTAVLDAVALRWGFDSTDSVDSPEWERRQ